MWTVDLDTVITAEQRAAEAAAAAHLAEFPNLEPDQFWFGLRASGHEQDLRAWLAAANDPESPSYDPVFWAAATAKLEFAKYFERDHDLIEAARQALGMSAAQLDDLWRFAAS
jgi:hypothetical protein